MKQKDKTTMVSILLTLIIMFVFERNALISLYERKVLLSLTFLCIKNILD